MKATLISAAIAIVLIGLLLTLPMVDLPFCLGNGLAPGGVRSVVVTNLSDQTVWGVTFTVTVGRTTYTAKLDEISPRESVFVPWSELGAGGSSLRVGSTSTGTLRGWVGIVRAQGTWVSGGEASAAK